MIGLFLVLHIWSLGVLFFLERSRRIRVPVLWLLLSVVLPVTGQAGAILMHRMSVSENRKRRNTETERQQIDLVFRKIQMDLSEKNEIVPLEEALRVNQAEVRRELMMEVLNDRSGSYVSSLREARDNEDIEVVHYATTAMAELSKEYDLRLQELESRYKENPDNLEVIRVYSTFLGEYIEKEIAEGGFLKMQRYQYCELILKELEQDPHNMELRMKLVQTYFILNEFSKAERVLAELKAEFPQEERVWMLLMEYQIRQKHGNGVQDTIREWKETVRFFSPQAEQMIQFWTTT